MRRWSELAERLAATTRTSEKTAILADYLRDLSARGAADRRGLPDRPAVRRGGPAGDRSRLVGDRDDRDATSATSPRSALGEAYDRSSDLGIAVADVLAAAGHAPPPEVSPTLPEVAAAFAAIEAASGPARKSAILRDAARALRPADRQGHRQGPGRRPADRAARGPRRGGHRQGLRPAARRRQVGRDARRRRRAAGRPRPRRRASASAALPSSTRSSSCSRHRPRTPPRSSPGSGPEVWVEDKYDGIRAQLHKRGTRGPALLARPARHQHRLPGDRRGGRGRSPGTASSMARSSAGATATVLPFIALQARLGRKAPSAAIQAEVPGHLRRLRCARARARRRRAGRAAAARAADRAPRAGSTRSTCRSPTTAAGSPARTWRSPPTPTRSRRPSSTRAPGATRA